MLEIIRGDSKTIKVQVLSKISPTDTGLPFDLTGFTARLTIKRNEGDQEPVLQEAVNTIDSPELGAVVFNLKPAKTELLQKGTAVYDVEIRKGADATLEVYTVAKGTIKIINDITN